MIKILFICHRNNPASAGCLGLLNKEAPLILPPFPAQLVIHMDFTLLKVDILLSQTAELADPHSRSQQYHKLIIILAVGSVVPDKVHPDCFLFFCQSDPRNSIIHHRVCDLEGEGVPANDLLIPGHIKRRFDHAADIGNRTVPFPFLLLEPDKRLVN